MLDRAEVGMAEDMLDFDSKFSTSLTTGAGGGEGGASVVGEIGDGEGIAEVEGGEGSGPSPVRESGFGG